MSEIHHTRFDLPVAVVGAGPIGLAAAAHLTARDERYVVFEAGPEPAGSVRQWGHVPLFTPWRYNVDQVAARLLADAGWIPPDPDAYPTGHHLIDSYLQPLAVHPAIRPSVRYNQRVVSIARGDASKLDHERSHLPFVITTVDACGKRSTCQARAVIDASGTWFTPNPLGSSGLPVDGEGEHAAHLHYRIPDILGSSRGLHLGKRTLVAGSGHSALHVLSQLATLAEGNPETRVLWSLRRDMSTAVTGGCGDDELTERVLIRREVERLVQDDRIQVFPGSRIVGVDRTSTGLVARTATHALPPVDEIVVATGFRPDFGFARELRLDLHPVFECAYDLADIIDPEVAACGTVPPHGVSVLAHPEASYIIAGAKSYGRAPTFLLLTGYEQVRSIVCALTGDEIGANTIELELPERGLCSACTAFLEERSGTSVCACDPDDDEDGGCCSDADDISVASGVLVTS